MTSVPIEHVEWQEMLLLGAGDSLQVWDPIGSHMHYSSGKSPAKGSAKSYRHVGSNLPSRFADQYAPWAFGGDTVEQNIFGTLLRLPLRQEGTAEGLANVRQQHLARDSNSLSLCSATVIHMKGGTHMVLDVFSAR